MEPMKALLILPIKGYRLLISPLLPPMCRFEPTCSCYAIEAIDRFGAWRGSGMAVRRILRCHPLHPGGYDPVPSLETDRKGSRGEQERCHNHDSTHK